MQPAVAKNENGVVITSSPGPIPSPIKATSKASVPLDTPIACLTPMYAATSCSKALDLGSQDEPPRSDDPRGRFFEGLFDGRVLRDDVEHRDTIAAHVSPNATHAPSATWYRLPHR